MPSPGSTRRCTRWSIPIIAAVALVSACSEPGSAPGTWEQTGEILALSGGNAGARGACVTCHGLEGEGDGQLSPRLAGLDAGYIARQLEFFSAGYRRHPQMVWIADQLDWPARQEVAFHYAGLTVPAAARAQTLPAAACSAPITQLYHEGDPARGIQACAACHGDDGAGVGEGNPPLAAQPAAYLAEQLHKWRKGERYGDPLDSMTHVSRLLAEQEIDPLAAYAAHLPGSSSYPEPRATCPQTRRPGPRNGV